MTEEIYTNTELDNMNQQQLTRALQSLQSNINARKRPNFADTIDRLKLRIKIKHLESLNQS